MLLSLTLALTPVFEIERTAIAAVVDPYVEAGRTPGAVVVLIEAGRPGTAHAFGLADVASARTMQPTTRFQVGSVTKPLTALLAGRLAEAEVWSLTDAVGRHWPDAHAAPADVLAITLEELLAHTSGLPREPVNRVDLPDSPSVMVPMSTAELFQGLERTSVDPEQIGVWSYSNLGYGLVGALASEVSGRPYDELVRERVLAPLSMADSGVYVGSDPPPGLASCYWPEDDELVAREPWRFGTACAFSGLVSTGGDLARFVAAQMDEGESAVLSSTLRAELHRAVVTIDSESGRAMAKGWFIDPLPGGLVALGHGGEVDGHSSVIAFFPALDAGLVVLCNRGGKAAEGLAFALMGALLPRLARRAQSFK